MSAAAGGANEEAADEGSGVGGASASGGGGLKAVAAAAHTVLHAAADYGLQVYQERNERQGRLLAELVGSTAFIETCPTRLHYARHSNQVVHRDAMLGHLPPGNPDFTLFMRQRRRVDVGTHAWRMAQRAKAVAAAAAAASVAARTPSAPPDNSAPPDQANLE
jgi:hypothetical protein